jgi:tRNA-Thr(GGU) m(6)t(6)A37 methyltransferase TsaA
MQAYTFEPIGRIHSCFTEKFGIPRQAGLVPEARAILEILPPYQRDEAFRGLERFSHIWILFVFHQCQRAQWRPTVRPPRLGGNRRIGVFASRSGYRPNPIGQSAVELTALETTATSLRLHLKGVDLLDGTPVLDIKPYLAYADSVPGARSGYAQDPPGTRRTVCFSDQAATMFNRLEGPSCPQLRRLIIEVLSQDPRPAYLDGDASRNFGMRLWDINIRFRIDGETILVTALERDPA